MRWNDDDGGGDAIRMHLLEMLLSNRKLLVCLPHRMENLAVSSLLIPIHKFRIPFREQLWKKKKKKNV